MPGSAPAGASATRPGLRRRQDEPARRRGVSFFARHAQSLQKAIDRRPADHNALACQLRLQLLQRRIRLGRQQAANASLMASQRERLLPATPRLHATGPPPALDKLDRTTFADRELLRCSPARAPASTARTIRSRRSNEYGFAIQAGLLNPATSLNHKFHPKGIPPDSFRPGNA